MLDELGLPASLKAIVSRPPRSRPPLPTEFGEDPAGPRLGTADHAGGGHAGDRPLIPGQPRLVGTIALIALWSRMAGLPAGSTFDLSCARDGRRDPVLQTVVDPVHGKASRVVVTDLRVPQRPHRPR